jgi:hypothetical protein
MTLFFQLSHLLAAVLVAHLEVTVFNRVVMVAQVAVVAQCLHRLSLLALEVLELQIKVTRVL